MSTFKHILQLSYTTFFILVFSQQIMAQQFRALLITETSGWHHTSVPNAIAAMRELSATHSFDLTWQQAGMEITAQSLRGIDVIVCINTTGDIFNDREQEAIKKFIQSGKGYVGVHAASDTEYDWEWYTKLVGRMFHIHPEQQTAKLKIIDHNFPGLEHFPNTLLWTDEWYEFGEEKVSDLNYLIKLDPKSFDPNITWKDRDVDANGKRVDRVSKGRSDFHPIAWYHEYDGGRAFYTALGHKEKVYENPWFLSHLYGGIYYAATGKGIEEK